MSKYYNSSLLLSHNSLISMCMSGRGFGKTYNAKTTIIDRYLKKKELSCYVRRYQSEIKKVVKKFWGDMIPLYPNLEFDIIGNIDEGFIGTINGENVVYFIAISTSSKMKSDSFPKNLTLMIFDEYIITKSTFTRYLDNEMTLFNDCIESIFRPGSREKDNYQILLLANSVSYVNPLFSFYNIEVNTKKRFTKYCEGLFTLELYENNLFSSEKSKTSFAKLLQTSEQGREYSNYAIGNVALEDNNDFLTKRTSDKYEFISSFIFDNFEVGIWFNLSNNTLLADKKIDTSNTNRFALHSKDVSPNHQHVKPFVKSWRVTRIKQAFYQGNLYFTNQEIKKFVQFTLIKYI